MRHNNIDGVIFDLDDTLFDCTGQLSGAARQRAADVICSQKPDLDIQTLIQCQETLSETLGSSGALKEIGRQYGLSDTLLNQARSAYNLNIVENITPFPETVATLDRLAQRGYKLALVTSGHPDRQRLKVEQLQLTAYFHEKNGTLVLHDDQKSTDKGPFIQQAADQLNLPTPWA
jgi:FMN phosphatase YigB (HAD superfamily)